MKIFAYIKYIKNMGMKNIFIKLLNRKDQYIIERNYYKNYKININSLDKQKYNECKISIVVPLYKTPTRYLVDMIDSVKNQSYNNWELCLVNAGNSHENMKIIESYCKNDDRILLKNIEDNLGIANNTNIGIEYANGDYIGFLDHDDILVEDAMYEVNKCIQEEKPDVIYSDEDKTNDRGKKKFFPHIKSDWAPTSLMSYNYICHFLVVKKELIDKYGKISSDYEGSQDYEFIMRICMNANNIVHIPKILYHWRVNSNSTAGNIFNKNYALESGKKAIREYYMRKNIEMKVEDSCNLGAYISSLKNMYKKQINLIIYGNTKFTMGKNICSLDKYDINIFFHEIKNNKIYDKNGNEISNHLFTEKIKVNEYTLVCNEYVEIIDDTLMENLIPPILENNVVISSPMILRSKNIIRSMGLFSNNGELEPIYGDKNFNLSGYMGRLHISQNVIAVEPLIFLTKTDFFINDIEYSHLEYKKWIDLCMRIYNQKKYISVNPNSKALYLKKDKIIKSKIDISVDPYIKVLEYLDKNNYY